MLLLGLYVGSFLNVIVSRKDWYKSYSCDSCGQSLKWHDLIPVVSVLVLKGRCRHCKAKIGKNRIISELLLGLGFVVVSISSLPVTERVVAYIVVLALGYNAISDMHEGLTYTWVIYGTIAIVGILKILVLDYTLYGLLISLASYIMFAAMCFLLSIIGSRYVGAGDLDVIFLLFICSRAYSLILFFSLVLTTIYMMLKNKKVTDDETIAFVPYLYIGYLISIITGGF